MKIGDRVKMLITDEFIGVDKDETGIVTGVRLEDKYPYQVKFDNQRGYKGAREWCFAESELEVINAD